MKISREALCTGRVLHEDDDFLTVEIAKSDDVTFTLQQDENGETVGGDVFLTVLFVRPVEAEHALEVWKPWEQEA